MFKRFGYQLYHTILINLNMNVDITNLKYFLKREKNNIIIIIHGNFVSH